MARVCSGTPGEDQGPLTAADKAPEGTYDAAGRGRAIPPNTAERPPDDIDEGSPFPSAASSTLRSVVTWWVIFAGPVAITMSLIVANAIDNRRGIAYVFTIGVWAFTLTLGLAAAPRSRSGLWWITPVLLSFLSATVAFGFVLLISGLSDHISDSPRKTFHSHLPQNSPRTPAGQPTNPPA
jgi:hypothetical protein